jgi:protein-tyrosine phosphatase
MPAVDLASEHYFDDTIYKRLLDGEGLLYPGGHAVLIELSTDIFPARFGSAMFELRRKKLRPVLAHPERYTPVMDKPTLLDPICDGGTLLLLDVCSLVGKYGKAPQRAAEELLEGGYYYAACTDAHRPRDVEVVDAAMERLVSLMGEVEAEFLLGEGPRNILSGKVDT